MESRGVAFYCVADSDYFVGLVALLNSLRLHGHDEPVYVLDRGLLPHQRRLLERHVTLVRDEGGQHAILSKSHAPLRFPADAMLLIDSDMIVTRSLSPLIGAVASGRVVAFADAIDRFVPEWQSLLDLPPLRRTVYVNSGFFGLPRGEGLPLLERVREAQQRVSLGGSRLGGGTPTEPFYFPDQDAWNAVLASTVRPEALWVLDNRLAPFPPFDGVVLDRESPPGVGYEGGEAPYFLHYISRKPWLAPTPRSVYTRLMKRMLFGPDLLVRVQPRDVPRRLRTGRLAEGAGLFAEGAAWFAARRGKLGIRPRVTAAVSELKNTRYSAVP
jgi:hypothetical protein